MFILQNPVPVDNAATLDSSVGYVGQIALDADTGDRWVKLANGWVQATNGGSPVPVTITADDVQCPEFTTEGGHTIPAGTLTEQVKAIADLADPGA